MNVISGLRNSGFLAQSAYSAAVATNDDLGRKISTTYLTAVDLSPYATETLVEETSGAITSLIPTNYYPDTNPSGFISGVDLSDYQTIAGMTAYQPVGDYYSASNPSGFITGVDLTPYATTAEVDTLSSMLSGAIDYVSANAGDEFPASANEAITAYQTNSATYLTSISIPESASWNEVSSTVNTNSASWNDVSSKQDTLTFGYDGQDKISAINNSGIAGGSFDVMPISGTGSVNVYEQTNVLWVSGKDFTSDISYISGTIGDVETLLASL